MLVLATASMAFALSVRTLGVQLSAYGVKAQLTRLGPN